MAAEQIITAEGSEVTGVAVTIDRVAMSVIEAQMYGMQVANPAGFKSTPYFMKSGSKSRTMSSLPGLSARRSGRPAEHTAVSTGRMEYSVTGRSAGNTVLQT